MFVAGSELSGPPPAGLLRFKTVGEDKLLRGGCGEMPSRQEKYGDA